jgi:hypothetical protein
LPAVNRAKAGAFAYVFASNFFTGLSSAFQYLSATLAARIQPTDISLTV